MPDTQPHGARSAVRVAEPAGLPGIALGLAVALGSGIAFSIWGVPQLAAERRDANSASALAEVATSETIDALSTMEISGADRARLARKNSECGPGLAWVSIAEASGQPAGRIRVKSGNYFSPLFTLGDQPVRIAIPYPAPYQGGHGSIAVFVVEGAAVVALMPAWHVPASSPGSRSVSVRNVTWQPRASCDNAHG